MKQTQEQLEEVTRDRQQLRSQLTKVQAENEALKQPATELVAVDVVDQDEARSTVTESEQQPAPPIDLSDKAGEVASYLKTLLCDEKLLNSTLTKIKRNKPVSLPREVISKVEGILSGDDKKPPTDARELLNEG